MREDAVFVSFGDGRMARMKWCVARVLVSSMRMEAGSVRLRARCRFSGGIGARRVEAGHLGQGVDSGIGAAGALGQRRFAGDAAESGLQFALDGGLAGLHLPALEASAIVGEGYFPSLERRCGLVLVAHGNRWLTGYPNGAESTV